MKSSRRVFLQTVSASIGSIACSSTVDDKIQEDANGEAEMPGPFRISAFSEFNPRNYIPTTTAWWDADSIESASSGTKVKKFREKYLNTDRDLIQNTSGNKPALAIAVQGGKNAARFTGTQFLQSGTWLSSLGPECWILVVASCSDGSTFRVLHDGIGPSNRLIHAVNASSQLQTYMSVLSHDEAWGSRVRAILTTFSAVSGSPRHAYADDGLPCDPLSAAATANSITGLTLGANYIGGNPWRGDAFCIAAGTGSPTTAQRNALLNAARTKYGINLLPAVFTEGDSLTAGNGATGVFGNYPSQLRASIGLDTVTVCNRGIGGQTLAQMITAAPTGIDILGLLRAIRIVILWGGTNDLQGGASSATVLSRIASLYNLHTAVPNTRVIVCTITPRADAGWTGAMETNRLNVNTGLRSTYPILSDFAAIPELQDPNDPIYYSDKLHFTTVGYGLIAANVKPIVLSMLS